MKKFLASVIAASVFVSSVSAFAQITETKVDTIDNAAVVAFGDVTAHQSMRIEGDVYAGGTVKFDNASVDCLDGDIISPNAVQYQDEYSAILKDTNRKGVDRVEDISGVLDKYYPDKYLIDNSATPQIPSYDVEYKSEDWVSVNEWDTWFASFPKDENGYPYYTVSENISIGGLQLQGAKLVIDASNAPVYIGIGQLSCSMANDRKSYIEVIGDNPVYLITPGVSDIFLNVVRTGDNTFDFGTGNVKWIVRDTYSWQTVGADESNSMICADIYYEAQGGTAKFNCPIKGDIYTGEDSYEVYFGSQANIMGDIYGAEADLGDIKSSFTFDGRIEGDIVTKASVVTISNSGQYNDERIAKGNVNAIKAEKMSISSSVVGNIVTSAKELVIVGGSNPTQVSNVQGTVYAPKADVTISATYDKGIRRGQLICNSLDIFGDGAVIWGKAKNEKPDETPAPTEAPTPAGDEVDLYGLGYAYIFGYEPGAPVDGVTPIYMAPNDSVTREQVASMLMRMIDQKNNSKQTVYPLTANISAHKGTWYERGLAYLASKGTFDSIANVEVGPVTRGEVAKLIAYGLNLSDTTQTPFTDIADSQYKAYIEIMYAYGYMEGVSDTAFDPNRVMTRAEFCRLFNNIIGREEMGLETADGHTVTAGDYSIVDINGHWAYETILKATSAYDKNGYVDFAIRQDNIRNKLDNYDSQMDY